MVEVKTRVHGDGCRDNVIPDVAARGGNVGSGGQLRDRGEVESVVHEFKVSAFLRALVDRGHEGLVEGEDGGVFV